MPGDTAPQPILSRETRAEAFAFLIKAQAVELAVAAGFDSGELLAGAEIALDDLREYHLGRAGLPGMPPHLGS